MPIRVIEIERPASSAVPQLLWPLLTVAAFGTWFHLAARLPQAFTIGVTVPVVACLGILRLVVQRRRHRPPPPFVADELAVCRIAADEADHPWSLSQAAARIARRQQGVVVVIRDVGCRPPDLASLRGPVGQPVEPFRVEDGNLAAERLGVGGHLPGPARLAEMIRAALPFSLWIVAISVVASHGFRVIGMPLEGQLAIPAMNLALIPLLILINLLANRIAFPDGFWVTAGALAFRRSKGPFRTLYAHDSCLVVRQGLPGTWDMAVSDGKGAFATSVPAQSLPALLACWLSSAGVPIGRYLDRRADSRETWLRGGKHRRQAIRRSDTVRVITIDRPAPPLWIRLVRPILLCAGFAAMCWFVARKDCLGLAVFASPVALVIWHLRRWAAQARRVRELGESAEATESAIRLLATEVSRSLDPNWRELVRSVARVRPGTVIASCRRHWALPELVIPPPCPRRLASFDLRRSRAVAELLSLRVPHAPMQAAARYITGFFLENTLSVVLLAILVAWWISAPTWMLFTLPCAAAANGLVAILPAVCGGILPAFLPARERVRIGAGQLTLRWSGESESTFVAREACMALAQDRFAAVTIWISDGARAVAIEVPADSVPGLLALWQAEEHADGDASAAMIEPR